MRRDDCRISGRGPASQHRIGFEMYNKTLDHAGGMKPLIDAALQKGAELAQAYIDARRDVAA